MRPREPVGDSRNASDSAIAQRGPVTLVALPHRGGQTRRVLIVHDAAVMPDSLAESLTRDGYSCALAAGGDPATLAVVREAFDIVICDIAMDGVLRTGLLELLAHLRQPLPLVIATSLDKPIGPANAGAHVAMHYLETPCTLRTLEGVMAGGLEKAQLESGTPQREPEPLRFVEFDRVPPRQGASLTLVGEGHAMTVLRDRIARVAVSSAPALIVGERGAGKSVVAHAIHSQGPRRERAFVSINTSAIPSEMLESEIFGHVRGLFPRALAERRGLLLAAQGGTLFLDEVGDLPLSLQAKLLRVIELGESRAVGSDTVRAIDVRVIAATHLDLPKLVAEGLFREDFYARLNVLPICVPALRERREDIPKLALHFLERARARMPSSPVWRIDNDALDVLTLADWPENVRQLAAAMERLVVFGECDTITPSQIARSSGKEVAPPVSVVAELCAPSMALCTVDCLTKAHVAWVLTRVDGSSTGAGESAGESLPAPCR